MPLIPRMPEHTKRLWIVFGLFLWTFLVFGVAVIVGLALAEKGIPHSLESSNGRYRAYVKSYVTVNPPRQTLWLRDMRDGRERRLADLQGESERIEELLWSPDDTMLACLTRGSRLMIFTATLAEAAEAAEPVFDQNLDRSERYPGNRRARNLRFMDGGRSLSYDLCWRWKAGVVSRHEVSF